MNAIWFTVITLSCIILTITSPESVLPAFLTGAENGVNLALSLLPIYIVWSGLISVMDSSGLSQKISKLLSPLTRKLFPNESEETQKYITLNFSANLLGAGGAATPLGIQAVRSMSRGDKITPSMVLFAVINTTSIQLIPTTVISLLSSNGATNPYSIIIPTIIISTLSTLLAVLIWSIIYHKK